jgi:hypothetical protein
MNFYKNRFYFKLIKDPINVNAFENNLEELFKILSSITGINFNELKNKNPIIYNYDVYIVKENQNTPLMSTDIFDKNRKTTSFSYKFYSYNFDHTLLAESSIKNTIPIINIDNCPSIDKERKRNISSLNHSSQNQNLSNLALEPTHIQNYSNNTINILQSQQNVRNNEPIDLNDNNNDIEANVELSVISLSEQNNSIDTDESIPMPNEYSEDVARLYFLTKRFLDSASTNIYSIYEGLDESRLFGYTFLNKYESTHQHKTLDNINTNDGRIISNEPVTVSVPANSLIKVESPHRNGKNKKKQLSSLCQPKSDHTQINKEKQSANALNDKSSSNNSNNAYMTAIATSSNASSPQKLDQSLLDWIALIEFSLTDQNNNDITINETNDANILVQEEDSNRKRLKSTDQNVLRLRSILLTLTNTFLNDLMMAADKLKRFRQNLIELVKDLMDDKLETFVQLMFDFLNENLFFKLLDSVKVEWSYRLKSYLILTYISF